MMTQVFLLTRTGSADHAFTLSEVEIVNPQNGGDFHFTELAHAHSLLESGKSSGKLAVYWQTPPAAEIFNSEGSAS